MSSPDESTQRLVSLVKSGDTAAMDDLCRRYLPRVARMVAMELGLPRRNLPVDQEDIAQEAIWKAIKGLPRFEARGPGAFAAWLKTIVINVIRSQCRAADRPGTRCFWQRYGDLDLNESIFASGGPSPSRCAASEEANDRVEALLLGLPNPYRQAVSLRFFGGLSHAEMAQELGRTEVSCRKLVERGIGILRQRLGAG